MQTTVYKLASLRDVSPGCWTGMSGICNIFGLLRDPERMFYLFLAPTGAHSVTLSRTKCSRLEHSFFIFSAQLHFEQIRMTSG